LSQAQIGNLRYKTEDKYSCKNKFRVSSAVGLLTARTLALPKDIGTMWRAVPGVQLLANFEIGKLFLHHS